MENPSFQAHFLSEVPTSLPLSPFRLQPKAVQGDVRYKPADVRNPRTGRRLQTAFDEYVF